MFCYKKLKFNKIEERQIIQSELMHNYLSAKTVIEIKFEAVHQKNPQLENGSCVFQQHCFPIKKLRM